MKTSWYCWLERNVGSVLINRMIEEKDFEDIIDTVFSTSQAGKDGLKMVKAQYGQQTPIILKI